MRSSFADTVTTVLGGIPLATETITDIDMASPREQMVYARQQSSKSKRKAPLQIKARPQSSI
jgi:orotate phosphoribosyltransferase